MDVQGPLRSVRRPDGVDKQVSAVDRATGGDFSSEVRCDCSRVLNGDVFNDITCGEDSEVSDKACNAFRGTERFDARALPHVIRAFGKC